MVSFGTGFGGMADGISMDGGASSGRCWPVGFVGAPTPLATFLVASARLFTESVGRLLPVVGGVASGCLGPSSASSRFNPPFA